MIFSSNFLKYLLLIKNILLLLLLKIIFLIPQKSTNCKSVNDKHDWSIRTDVWYCYYFCPATFLKCKNGFDDTA